MMTGTPHRADSFAAMIRGRTSNSGPGGTGTTILIVRLGKSSAAAAPRAVATIVKMAAMRQVVIEERARWFTDYVLQAAVRPQPMEEQSCAIRKLSWGRSPGNPPKCEPERPGNRDRPFQRDCRLAAVRLYPVSVQLAWKRCAWPAPCDSSFQTGARTICYELVDYEWIRLWLAAGNESAPWFTTRTRPPRS